MKIKNENYQYIYLLSFASILITGCNSKTDVNAEESFKKQGSIFNWCKVIRSDTNTNPIVALKIGIRGNSRG